MCKAKNIQISANHQNRSTRPTIRLDNQVESAGHVLKTESKTKTKKEEIIWENAIDDDQPLIERRTRNH